MARSIYRLLPSLVLGIAVVAIGLIHTDAHAQSDAAQAITLSPASSEFVIKPGAADGKTVDIINSGTDSFNVKLSVSPYHVTGENYDPKFTQLPGTVDPSSWVKLSSTDESVGPAKVLTVPYTIKVPKGTAPGGYYAVIFAETTSNSSKTGVVSHNRVGNILYITVDGDIKSGGNVAGDGLPFLHFMGPVSIGTKVSNSGGTHFVTKAKYTVTNYTGKTVFSSSTERYILPQTEREFKTNWTPQTLFNIYTVHRSATVAGVEKKLPDQKIVVVNPWLLIGIAFLLGILIGVPLQRARQRSRSHKKAK